MSARAALSSQTLDTDGDGFISVAEARAAQEAVGHAHRSAEEVIAAADSDGDGKLSYIEVRRRWMGAAKLDAWSVR